MRVVDFSRLVGLGPVSVFGHGEVNLVVLDHDLLDFPFLHLSDEGAIVRYVYFRLVRLGKMSQFRNRTIRIPHRKPMKGFPLGRAGFVRLVS